MSDRKAEDEDPDLHIYSDLHGSKKDCGFGLDLLCIFFNSLLPPMQDKGG
jgi:hypothetical protein